MGIFSLLSAKDRAPAPAFTAGRRQDRTVDELIGVCRGILADGAVSTQESQFLQGWLERNAACAQQPMFAALLRRLHDALSDGVVDVNEERDLLDALTRLVGGEADGESGSESASLSTALPLNSPAPAIVSTASFVVTGTFTFGPRVLVMDAITTRGGSVATAISKKVGFLIVGEIGSRDWIHSSYGRKIEKAVELRESGAPIAIVSERHWATNL